MLVFVDADVRLAPHALAAAVGAAAPLAASTSSRPTRGSWPATLGERLVQPLLQWSWLTHAAAAAWPSARARPSLRAANGQFLAVDAAAYRRAGGHAAVRGEVLDDVALLRAVKRAGGRGGVVDGTHLATCRMYEGWPELREGYTKSLWSAFGLAAGRRGGRRRRSAVCYVLPPLAALRGSRAGLRRVRRGGRRAVAVAAPHRRPRVPDALAHPVSVGRAGRG